MPRGIRESYMTCSFCGRSQRDVRKLIAGPSVYICNECVRACNEIIAVEHREKRETEKVSIPPPKEIAAFLDKYVVGQWTAKKILSVAVYNHYKRIALRKGQKKDVEIQKSNILLLGPTGSGKTLLAQALARYLHVPFTMVDATSLTQAGYVGEDVENIVASLLWNANNDVSRAQHGIVYLDEIDKIARHSGSAPSSTRDVSGEGVQQALLKIIEGSVTSVPPKGAKKHNREEYVQVDTAEVLFICGGAFNGLEQIISRRTGVKGLGFGAELREGGESGGQPNILEKVEVEDVLKFGMIPELMGRLPVIVPTKQLTETELIEILTRPRNALVKQYQKLFRIEGLKLSFSPEALKAVAAEAMRRKGGARALRAIMEEMMLDIMYDVPYRDGIMECTITEEVVKKKGSPLLTFEKARGPGEGADKLRKA